MALYHEAASFLTPAGLASSDSLASRVYGRKSAKSSPSQIYALLSEASKWSSILSEVVTRANLLQQERKLTPALALLLSHDLLLSKRGIALPKAHLLHQTLTKHKTRLNAEFTKSRIKSGFASVSAWRIHIDNQAVLGDTSNPTASYHPRWIRINALTTDLDHQIKHGLLDDWQQCDSLNALFEENQKVFYVDENIPSLIAVPPKTDLTKTKEYRNGDIILQDKASCFSAYLLDPQPSDGDIIDGCSAPGNKTTHLAAILKVNAGNLQKSTIFAVERDEQRSKTLEKMVTTAKADTLGRVKCLTSQDFSKLSPSDSRFKNVGAILLDPSCSGSGIVGRDQGEDSIPLSFVLPSTSSSSSISSRRNPKAKRRSRSTDVTQANAADKEQEVVDPDSQEWSKDEDGALKSRLEGLSGFQLSLIRHAFAFPAARKVTYSTCSIHAEENELVVLRALGSDIAKRRGWKVLKRQDQVEGMRRWPYRGDRHAVERHLGAEENTASEIAEACIRCQKGTKDGTMGFFVVAFVREAGEELERPEPQKVRKGLPRTSQSDNDNNEDDDEWDGFSD